MNSDAVISPQTIKEGVVTITIVEGTVAEINITGTDHLNPNYVKDRLELAIGTPLDLNELLEALRLLQIDPVIENISAELARGVRPEASILNVTVTEANTFDLSAFANNGRSPSVGSFRRGVSLYHGNVFGLADKFNFAWANTDGSDSFDGSYAIPINARNGEIILTAGYRDTEIIEEPFNRLDILGDSVYYELTYRQPIVQSATKEFALGLTFSRQESSTEVLDTPFPLSRGADEEGETKISAIRLFQEYIKRNPRDVFALRSQFNIGVDVFDASDEEGFPDSNFLSWRGQGQYVRLLDRDTLFVVRTEIQLATDELLALEQFSLGGFNSVRGYRQDFLLTDNAFFASAEVRIPLLRAPEVEGLLQIIPFIDFGVGWNNGIIPDPDPNAIAGIGVGLQWQMGDRLDARIDFGVPLTDTNIEERTWQENGIYFNINYKLF
ncbi:MAG: ShlB/FhaC/HecB family hemolysin secretion/activation protein [Cyanobacteria bacterium J083]|nr:MAG: ShlB/FhaC/HecB family hemolysin secretion/activation protein [Cyanobacteria bacterium J083]